MTTARRIAALALVCVLYGCGTAANSPADAPDRDGRERLHQQANGALARWDAAVKTAGDPRAFAPVGELTTQIGQWEPEIGDNHKAAMLDGKFSFEQLPNPPRASAEVRWDDGRTDILQTVSAAEGLMVFGPRRNSCPDCRPIEITDARYATMRVATTRGEATIAAWEYTLRDSAVRLVAPAIDTVRSVAVPPPSWNPDNPPGGIWIERAMTKVGAGTMTVTFTGSPSTADQPCGADYTAEAVESANAVVVIVYEHRPPGEHTCNAIGASRTAVVELAAPLGERAVLEVVQGRPVLVTTTR